MKISKWLFFICIAVFGFGCNGSENLEREKLELEKQKLELEKREFELEKKENSLGSVNQSVAPLKIEKPAKIDNIKPLNIKTREEIKEDLRGVEIANSHDYLVGSDGRYRIKILSKEIVLTGKISNTAKFATYQKILLSVIFYSKTGVNLGTEVHTINEKITAGKSLFYTKNIRIPNYINKKELYEVGVRILRAEIRY